MHKSKLNIAIQAALGAGKFIMQRYNRLDTVKVAQKGKNDFITDVDKGAETFIVDTIREAFPQHDIISEETTFELKNDDHCWIIDPIDGTSNFIHGYPYFSVSIALQYKKETVVAVIYNPNTDELYSSIKGAGAQLNHQRIRVSKNRIMTGSMVGVSFSNREHSDPDRHLRCIKAMYENAAQVRHGGSAALDLAHVACGRLDGYWAYTLKPWDVAAGALIVAEAGGIISNFDRNSHDIYQGDFIAGNPRLHEMLCKVITRD